MIALFSNCKTAQKATQTPVVANTENLEVVFDAIEQGAAELTAEVQKGADADSPQVFLPGAERKALWLGGTMVEYRYYPAVGAPYAQEYLYWFEEYWHESPNSYYPDLPERAVVISLGETGYTQYKTHCRITSGNVLVFEGLVWSNRAEKRIKLDFQPSWRKE